MVRKVNLEQAFGQLDGAWTPIIAGLVNETAIKVVRLSGAFEWHRHEAEDEMFLVVDGRLRMELRDQTIDVGPGEFLIVPRGVEHCPQALEEPCHVLLVEPRTTVNTGNLVTARTVTAPASLAFHSDPLSPLPTLSPHP